MKKIVFSSTLFLMATFLYAPFDSFAQRVHCKNPSTGLCVAAFNSETDCENNCFSTQPGGICVEASDCLVIPPLPKPVPSSGGGISNPIQAKTFGELVEAIARAITAIGIPLVAIFLVWAGFLFVTARGNEQQLERAKTTFFWAIVGGAVVIGAWAIAVAIVNFARSLG